MINFKNYLNLILNESVSDDFKKFLKNAFKVFIEDAELSDLLSTFSFYREIKKDFNNIGLNYANFILDFCNDNKSLFPNFRGIDCQAIKDIDLASLFPYGEDEEGLVKIEKGSECFINRSVVRSNTFYLFGPPSNSRLDGANSDYYRNALLRHCYNSGNCVYLNDLHLLGMHISHYGDTTVLKKIKNLLDFQKSTVLHKLKELANNDFYDFYRSATVKTFASKANTFEYFFKEYADSIKFNFGKKSPYYLKIADFMNNLCKEDNFEMIIQLVTEKLKEVKVYGNEDSEKQDFIAIDDVGLAGLFTDVIIELINELVINN
jgi:hypothetical protein